MTYVYLTIAIVAEVIGTTALSRSDGFSRLAPSLVTAVSYAVAFAFLSITLKVMPTGIAYAIWSGAGIVLISAVGWAWFGQRLDAAAMVGLGLIVAGVLVVNLLSGTVRH